MTSVANVAAEEPNRDHLCRWLASRRSGMLSSTLFRQYISIARTRRLELNTHVELRSPHNGPVNWADVDPSEGRYLLTGGADCTISIFDLEAQPDVEVRGELRAGGAGLTAEERANGQRVLRQLCRTTRCPLSAHGTDAARHKGHSYSVSGVQWYPVDTGMFVSCGMDGMVKLWDTNSMAVVLEFKFPDKVFACGMGARHGVIAAGTDDSRVRLCDIKSAGSTHVLPGHRGAIWTLDWCPSDDFLLATGSSDKTVRLWDIRRSGASACLLSLDHHKQLGAGAKGEDEQHAGYKRKLGQGPNVSNASAYARAHDGVVNALRFTPQGDYLLTSGADNRLRLWDVGTGSNSLMNYLDTHNRRGRPFRLGVASPGGRDGTFVFFPVDRSGDVHVYPVHSRNGRPSSILRGHFEPVMCCASRPDTQELITAGADGLLLGWTYPGPKEQSSHAGSAGGLAALGDGDDWSSDEDGEGQGLAPAQHEPFVPAILR